jgi:hypothetical protein
MASASHKDEEVVGIAHELPRPQAFAAALFAVPLGPTVPLPDEMIVKYRQGNVGKQRREDPALRGAGARLTQALILAEPGSTDE